MLTIGRQSKKRGAKTEERGRLNHFTFTAMTANGLFELLPHKECVEAALVRSFSCRHPGRRWGTKELEKTPSDEHIIKAIEDMMLRPLSRHFSGTRK